MQTIIQNEVTEIIDEAFDSLFAVNCDSTPADPEEGMPAEATYHLDYPIAKSFDIRNSCFQALHNLNAVEGVTATLEFFTWNDKREQFVLTVVDEFEDELQDEAES